MLDVAVTTEGPDHESQEPSNQEHRKDEAEKQHTLASRVKRQRCHKGGAEHHWHRETLARVDANQKQHKAEEHAQNQEVLVQRQVLKQLVHFYLPGCFSLMAVKSPSRQ